MTRLVDQIREACAWVATQAGHVRIHRDRIPAYAASLPLIPTLPATPAQGPSENAADERVFWLTLDAINFGSGWFPTLRKAPGRSGYFTIYDGLRRRFESAGLWTAGDLAVLKAGEIAQTLNQDPEHELMGLFAASLNDLGHNIVFHHQGSFEDAVQPTAVGLVEHLAGWKCFADSSVYEDRSIPFLKRAQIAAADLHRNGLATYGDLRRLTMFADNLVPHVLRLDGVLEFDAALTNRIDRQVLIEHGLPEEVEIRACALHAVELIAQASGRSPAELDQLLWGRGGHPDYKARPRHRSRCTAY
ncbi:MAG TPA: queuosine salvage family protein [Solirubrobacteraceae bacterium]|nr:queuosine salvage family protein [Solirubrobacteraceae bacterium]